MGKIIEEDDNICLNSNYDDLKKYRDCLADIEQSLANLNTQIKDIDESIDIIENRPNKLEVKNNETNLTQKNVLPNRRVNAMKKRDVLLEHQNTFKKVKEDFSAIVTIIEYRYGINEITSNIIKFLQESYLTIYSTNNRQKATEIREKYADNIIFLKNYIKEFESSMSFIENNSIITLPEEYRLMIEQERALLQDLYNKTILYSAVKHNDLKHPYRKFKKS